MSAPVCEDGSDPGRVERLDPLLHLISKQVLGMSEHRSQNQGTLSFSNSLNGSSLEATVVA